MSAFVPFPTPFRLPDFRPHPFVRGGHLQTIIGAWFHGERAGLTSIRRQITLPDGDQLLLHDDGPIPGSGHEPIALLVHGMCGCAESPTIRRIAGKLRDQGIRTFRINMRGCGDGKGLATHPYHAGRSEDIQSVIEEIHRICPNSPIHVAGFSLGGNIILKWLGERSQDWTGIVQSGIAVNPPVDLEACTIALSGQAYGLYERYFTRQLIEHVAKCPELGPRRPWNSVNKQPNRMIDFDEVFTAPQSGFRSALHYYESCSAAPHVSNIVIPTLVLSSADDPVIPVRIFEEMDRSEYVQLHVSESGGHLGFIGKSGDDPDRWWLDWRVVDWFSNAHVQFRASLSEMPENVDELPLRQVGAA